MVSVDYKNDYNTMVNAGLVALYSSHMLPC